jgi:hypothetical protein
MQFATYTIYKVQLATQEIEPELCITFMSCKRLNLLERNVRSIVAHLEAAEPSIRHVGHPKEHRVACGVLMCGVRCGAVGHSDGDCVGASTCALTIWPGVTTGCAH